MSYFPAAVHMGFLQLMLEIGIFGFSAFIYPIWYIGQSLLSECITFGFSNRAISFFLGVFTFGAYYCFHPHVGIFEFPYLGLIMGQGLISIYEYDSNNKKFH